MAVLILGDQLHPDSEPLADAERVVMIEACEFARRHAYHPHKLVLVFSAMRHARDRLRDAGYEVNYYQTNTFGEGFDAHFAEYPGDELILMEPPSHAAGARLTEMVEARGGSLDIVTNDLFISTAADWERFTGGSQPPYRHEAFYRFLRRQTGYLMEDGEPVGGEWNYDADNQQFPGDDYEPTPPPRYSPDKLTTEVIEWVDSLSGSYDTDPPGPGWAAPEEFWWPVTRADALDALDAFIDDRLAAFGPYQDAMLRNEWAMNHSLLAGMMNIGLLHPAEVIEAVIEGANDQPDTPVQSVEGFVRQVLGWREFMRHTYRETMPELATANQLGQSDPLPEFYWTGDTDMACVTTAADRVRSRGYSHHIERLMILSNFALLFGVEPAALNEWFHAAYVDAYHWVTTPNVIEMGAYGHGVFATKPYAASANYINRMSDYCQSCPYDHRSAVGEDACPFNTLYWDFLAEHEATLRDNHRMGLVYSHLDDKPEDEVAMIRERAAAMREAPDRL